MIYHRWILHLVLDEAVEHDQIEQQPLDGVIVRWVRHPAFLQQRVYVLDLWAGEKGMGERQLKCGSCLPMDDAIRGGS